MRGKRPATRTSAGAQAQLAMLLASCTDTALAGMTPESLAASHGVPVKEAEYGLTIARQRRASRGG
jgi:uncharacterized lipoprotein YbaY